MLTKFFVYQFCNLRIFERFVRNSYGTVEVRFFVPANGLFAPKREGKATFPRRDGSFQKLLQQLSSISVNRKRLVHAVARCSALVFRDHLLSKRFLSWTFSSGRLTGPVNCSTLSDNDFYPLIEARHFDPFKLLGVREFQGSQFARVLRPDAAEV